MNMKSFPPQAGRPLHSVTRWVCLFAGALILCVLTCSEIFGQETSHCHDAAGRDIPCPPSQSPAGKKAIIFFSPGLSARDLTFIEGGGVLGWRERRQEEFDYLRAQGYSVTEEVGSRENILRALLDKEVRAISYFGHNAYEDKPTIEDDDAKGWKLKVSGELQRRYSRQGLSPDEAFRRAVAESQNFGLELVRNMSCWSLANTSLAQQFVKPSGRYFGVRSRFSPCRSPMTFCGISSCELEEYRVTVGQSTPAPVPPTSTPSSSGIGGTWSAPNGDTVSLTQS
ncbi:MAG TPA: hypothetical protein VD966_09235, partial [Pyrinomonadaceae bacterium]|nr:hypothetical protein [Pyrinomonadaceae bacterium]